MTKKRRIAAALASLVLLIAVVFSSVYIIREAQHHCTGDSCPICREIQVCQQFLRSTGAALADAAALAVCTFFVSESVCVFFRAEPAVTLISLKVKLSD